MHALVVQIMINGAGSIRTTSDTGHQIIWVVTSFLLQQLLADFGGDYTLQSCHHIRVGVRPNGGTDDIECVSRMAAPVANGLVGGVLQGAVTAFHRKDFGTKHSHTFDIDVLSSDVSGTHIDTARQVHECTDGGSSHSVLSGSRLGDDAGLAHLFSQ